MCKANRSPGEKCRQTGQGQEPVEHSNGAACQSNVGDRAKSDNGDSRPERTSGAVNVLEDWRCVALLGQRSQGTGATIHTRQADGDDGEENDNVDVVAKCWNTAIERGNDEGGSRHIKKGAVANEALVVVWNQEADEEQGQNVEQCNTPKDLLHSSWQGSLRSLTFRRRKTNKLSTAERKSSSDEDRTQSRKAVRKRARVVPVASSVILIIWGLRAATANENKSNNHENDDCGEFQNRHPEFFFSISKNTKYVDDNDDEQEHSDPDCNIDLLFWIPVSDCQAGNVNFQR